MRRRPVALLLIVLALGGVAAAVVSGGGSEQKSGTTSSKRTAREALSGAPAPLAAVHRQANRLLGGGAAAFRERLRELRGYPVVVNKWASWCPPCRAEFPFFQRQAIERGREIAFLGVDANDADRDAARFLEQLPLTYPSYRDAELKVSAVFNGVPAFPTTAYYDSKGELAYVKQGGYASERKLVEDIERYAR